VDDVRSVKAFIDRAEDGREDLFVPPKKRSATRSERPAGPSSGK
jgi:hypothetical protein